MNVCLHDMSHCFDDKEKSVFPGVFSLPLDANVNIITR